MSSSPTPTYLLRFRLHADAPADVKEKYNKIYIPLCGAKGYSYFLGVEDTHVDDEKLLHDMLKRWLIILESENVGTPTDRQLLDRAEGGIGGNSNLADRQIRFDNGREKISRLRFGEITLRAMPSDDGKTAWTPGELVSFGNAFVKVVEYYTGTNGVIDFYLAIDLNCLRG